MWVLERGGLYLRYGDVEMWANRSDALPRSWYEVTREWDATQFKTKKAAEAADEEFSLGASAQKRKTK